MVALDWDEDEIITRDLRLPPGILAHKLKQPRIRISGPPALGFVPGAGLLGLAARHRGHQKRGRRALPLPGSPKPSAPRVAVSRSVSFFVPETDRLADQRLIDAARSTLLRAAERSRHKEQSEPSVEIDLAELEDEDLDTIELSPAAVEAAVESVVFELTKQQFAMAPPEPMGPLAAELPKKSPVLDMAWVEPPTAPAEPPPAPVREPVEQAPVSAVALSSRPGQLVSADDLDEAPPLVMRPGRIELLAKAADRTAPAAVETPRAPSEPARPAGSPDVMIKGTRDRRRADRDEEEHHRAAMGFQSTMPHSWVTVPALESAPALPLVVRTSANSLTPTALPQLPSGSTRSWRSRSQWLAAALTVCAMALLMWQLLPRDGSLEIALSEPTTPVSVYLDGVKKCDVTPCEIADVHAGARVITVLAPGFERSQTEVSVIAGQLTQMTLPMKAQQPPPAPTVQGVRAKSSQSEVEIFIDGDRRGELPIELTDLTPGQHRVLLSASDRYISLEQVVEIEPGVVLDLGSIELTLLRGVLTLEVRTPRTRVLMGTKGQRSSQKDIRGPWPRELELEPGHYDVIGAKDGFHPVAYSVTVDDAHPAPHVVIDLEPNPYAYDY